eukprot:2787635-Pyramimonas_sp.AAC.1
MRLAVNGRQVGPLWPFGPAPPSPSGSPPPPGFPGRPSGGSGSPVSSNCVAAIMPALGAVL